MGILSAVVQQRAIVISGRDSTLLRVTHQNQSMGHVIMTSRSSPICRIDRAFAGLAIVGTTWRSSVPSRMGH